MSGLPKRHSTSGAERLATLIPAAGLAIGAVGVAGSPPGQPLSTQ